MPPVIAAAGAAAATAFTSAGLSAAIAGTSITAALTSTATIAAAVSGAVLSGAAAALQTGMNQSSPPPPNAVLRQPIPTAQVVYGRARVGGALAVYHRSEDGSTRDLLLVWALACHEIDGVETIYNGDKVIWTEGGGVASWMGGKISMVHVHHGADDQAPDAALRAALPSSFAGATGANFRLRGHAYVVLRFEKIAKKWTGGLPNLSAVIRGAKPFDPRTGARAWTDNWALCVADYMTRDRGGAGLDRADLDEASVIAAANLSDESVAGLTGTQPRYRLNGAFSTATIPRETLEVMMAHGAGKIVDGGGAFQIHAGAFAPPVATLTEAAMVSPLRRSGATTMERMIDGVRAVFANPAAQYELDDAPALLFDGYNPGAGAARYLDLRLDRETNAERAQRLAVLAGRMTRRMAVLSVSVMAGFAALEAGDRVTVEHGALGLSGVFEVQAAVLNLSPAGPRVDLELVIDGPAFWAWSADTATAAPTPGASNLPSANVVEPPSGLTLTATARIAADGAAMPGVLVEWTASPDLYLKGYELRWTPAGGAERSMRLGAGTTRHEIFGEAEGAALSVELVAVNTLGIESDPLAGPAAVAPAADTIPPGLPTAFSALAGMDRVILSWANPADADFKDVLIREAGSASFGASDLIGATAATVFERPGLSIAETRFFWIASRDRTGNVSAWVGPVSAAASGVTAGALADAAVTATKLADGAVVASKLTIMDLANIIPGARMAAEDQPLWTATGPNWIWQSPGPPGFSSLGAWRHNGGGSDGSVVSAAAPVESLSPYLLQFEWSAAATGVQGEGRAIWLDGAGAEISSDLIAAFASPGGAGVAREAAILTPPFGAKSVRIRADIFAAAGAMDAGLGGFGARRAANGELIVDGAVTAQEISVGSLDAISADLGSITVDTAHIEDLTVTTAKIASDAVSEISISSPGTVALGAAYTTIDTLSYVADGSESLIECGIDPAPTTGYSTTNGTVHIWYRISLRDDAAGIDLEVRETLSERIKVASTVEIDRRNARVYAAISGAEIVAGRSYTCTVAAKYAQLFGANVTGSSTTDETRTFLRAIKR